jgi:hypothetical protein
MNTNFKISRQVALTINVLLTAMWLPLTAFAQDVSEAGDHPEGTNTQVENCTHCQAKQHSHDLRDCHHSQDNRSFSPGSGDRENEDIVGFGETDPTVHQIEDVVAAPQASDYLGQQISAGFSETDPASIHIQVPVTVLSESDSPERQVSVGFSETDPTISTNRTIEEPRNQHLVDCLGGRAKGSVLYHPMFSYLTEKGNQHEIS